MSIPDPMVMLRGLDRLVGKVPSQNTSLQFRINLVRSTLKVDSMPTHLGGTAGGEHYGRAGPAGIQPSQGEDLDQLSGDSEAEDQEGRALERDLAEKDLCHANISALLMDVGKERDAAFSMSFKKATSSRGVGSAEALSTLRGNAPRRRRSLLQAKS